MQDLISGDYDMDGFPDAAMIVEVQAVEDEYMYVIEPSSDKHEEKISDFNLTSAHSVSRRHESPLKSPV